MPTTVGKHRKPEKKTVAPKKNTDQVVRELYREHATWLMSFVMRFVEGNKDRAEDIVQETLIRAWRNLSILDPNNLRPWLATVARRLVIDEIRHRKARPDETGERELDSFVSKRQDTVDVVVRQIIIQQAILALTPQHREVLLATYWAGKTVPEAAKELNIPLGTAKGRVFHALRALKKILLERGVQHSPP